MNILFIVPYTPNLIRVRPYNFIRYLTQLGHQVTVATLWGSAEEQADLRALESVVERVIASPLPRWRSAVNSVLTLPTGRPLQAAFCWQPTLFEQLTALFEGHTTPPFDAVHVEHLRGVVYGLRLQSFLEARYGSAAPPVVWDSVDCIAYLFAQAARQSVSLRGQLMTRLELGRTTRYERWLLNQFSDILITSPHDRDAFLALRPPHDPPTARLHVVPNGVDLDYFQPDPTVVRDPATLVITGKMSYHANISMVHAFAHDILPLVWAKRPDARLEIVGKDPDRSILQLGQDPRIHVTGTVPDLRPYLQRATAAVAPIAYGAGIQNKVLEAMACGTPVVATPKATSALKAIPGRDLLVAEKPQAFAEAVLSLLDSPETGCAIGQAGLTFVREAHDWHKIAGQLTAIYRPNTRSL